MEFQLIIPCFNEARSLEAMVKGAVCAAQAAGFDARRFGLVVVDNGSGDHSAEVLRTLEEGVFGGWFSVVRIAENKGYGDGILQGLRVSEAAYVGWTHADEQCDPRDAFVALDVLRGQKEKVVVKGARHGRGWFDYCWSRGFELVVFLMHGVWVWDINAQPKVFSRELVGLLEGAPVDFSFDLFVMLRARKAGWRWVTVPVIFGVRAHGVSHWAFSFGSRVRTAGRMVRAVWRMRGVV